jgi:hypothetical protein
MSDISAPSGREGRVMCLMPTLALTPALSHHTQRVPGTRRERVCRRREELHAGCPEQSHWERANGGEWRGSTWKPLGG